MEKPVVILDMDGVLADFEGEFCRTFGWDNRELVRLEDRYPDMWDEIDLFSSLSSTYSRLDILELGVKIARFCENERLKICVVTSRPDYTVQTTGSWLKSNKIPFFSLSVENGSKMKRIEMLNPLFVVDDLLSVVERCAELGIPSFLIDHPWNQKENLDGCIHRIGNFDEFLGKFTTYFDI